MMRRAAAAAILAMMLIAALLLRGESFVDVSERLLPPSSMHLMGTDTFGRDVASRIGTGILVSASIAAAASSIALAAGLALSFFFSVWRMPGPVFLTAILTLKTVPPVLLALFLSAISGPCVIKLAAVLAIGHAADIAETAYSRVLVARSEDYTLSAIGLGKGRVDVYLHHILPAIMPYIAKQAVSIFSASILSEASLSFLGCGVPVTIPTLGSMLSEARPVMGQAPWLVAFPALFLFLIGLSLELLASGRSELDPSSH